MSASQGPGRRTSRPGSMTRAMQAVQTKPTGPKVLRIGLIQSGKIVEERIIQKRETVSVGSSEENPFVVAHPSVGSRFALFEIVDGSYYLNFKAGMRGRVGLPDGVKQLEELQSAGAKKSGDVFKVRLTDDARGKVVIGDTTLLFQFVVPPPVQARPQLPAAVVGGFLAGIDWLFTVFVAGTFILFFGLIIYMDQADWPVEPSMGQIPDRLAELIFNEPEPPRPPEEPQEFDDTEIEDGDEVTEVADSTPQPQQPTSSSQQTSSERQAQASADARLAVEQAQARVEQMLLGALGQGGSFQDVLQGGAVTTDAESVMRTADGVGVASGEAGTLRERGGGGQVGGATQGLGNLAGGSGRATQQQQEGERVVERVIRGRATVGSLEDESGSGVFDPNLVVRQIRLRLRQIQSCYERELRNNPTLAGRVQVRFTIQPTGSVSNASASENTTGSPAVGTCVVNAIRGMRFNPGPEGGAVSFAYPFVFAPQN